MMEHRTLGSTGISVSRICFGSLTMAPLQGDYAVDRAAEVMAYAFSRGIDFVDAAQLYRVYPQIRAALKRYPKADDIRICSKAYIWTADMALKAVDEARRELDRDVIDIFMLHEQESISTIRGHREALDMLYTLKSRGVIRAVGLSCHHVAAVDAAAALGLDVVFPLINVDGWGIVDGTRAQMERAIARASAAGLGVMAMKVFGGGNLHHKPAECLSYAFAQEQLDSIALGMQSEDEVDADIGFLETGAFTPAQEAALRARKRRLHIEEWCVGCGKCVKVCKNGAARVVDGRMRPDASKCVLCGYCGSVCDMYAIKIL